MQKVLDGMDFADAEIFVKALNAARLEHRKHWLVYVGTVAGLAIEIKTYDTGHLQIFRIDGQEQAATMDMKPTAWKDFIRARIEGRKVA